MRSFFILLRVQLLALSHSLKPGNRSGGALAVIAGIVLTLIIFLYMGLVAIGLVSIGLADAIPGFAVLIGALAGVVFTFLKANGTLFGLADFDLVMALPIPRRTVVAARVSALYASATLLGALLAAPLWAVYLALVDFSVMSVVGMVVSVLLAPAIPTAIATFVAFGVSAVASRFRHANLVYLIVSLVGFSALFIGLYGFSFWAQAQSDSITAAQMEGGIAFASDLLSRGWPPAALMGSAVADRSLGALAAFVALSLVIPGIALEIMQRNYLAINAALAGRARARALTARELRDRTGRMSAPIAALIMKEYRTQIGIPSYAFNCLFGYLLMLIIAVAISVVGLDTVVTSGAINGVDISAAEYASVSGLVANLLPWIFAFCAITCPSAACSVSIEGRSAWITSTLPLPVRTILGAKLAANAVPVAAALAISAAIMLATGQIDVLGAINVVVVGFGVFFLFVTIGLASDARKPNLTWATPNDVVKRGFPIMVVVLGGLAAVTVGAMATFALSMATTPLVASFAILALGLLLAGAGWLVFTLACRRTRLMF